MGVSQKDELNGEEDGLLITQTMPKANKVQMKDLLNKLEQDSQKLVDTNEVGFYVNSRIGLTFNREVISHYIDAYNKFKNSVFIVYDTSKSDFGMNPLRAYRLSEDAITALTLNGALQTHLIQSALLAKKMKPADFFEEIQIKIHRSHMQQAYLFDHIQPEMPAFNTNMFKLAQ